MKIEFTIPFMCSILQSNCPIYRIEDYRNHDNHNQDNPTSSSVVPIVPILYHYHLIIPISSIIHDNLFSDTSPSIILYQDHFVRSIESTSVIIYYYFLSAPKSTSFFDNHSVSSVHAISQLSSPYNYS